MLTSQSAWKKLTQHKKVLEKFSLIEAFEQDPKRAEHFSLSLASLYVDFSKNLITDETLHLLLSLAEQAKLKEKIKQLFSGEVINQSEQQAATHTELRDASVKKNHESWQKIRGISEKVRSGKWEGIHTPITDIINLGTGGSYLGPYMATQALMSFSTTTIKQHFFANRQDEILQRLLAELNPKTTLIIVSSKSFSTEETLHNFSQVMVWLQNNSNHCIAITAEPEKAKTFGIKEENILTFPPTIGGRYSIWSAIALPLCIQTGFDHFEQFLSGAQKMDDHFLNSPLNKNIPAILGLLDIWYINFYSAQSSAILPYHQDLYLLPRYLQQLSMESLGKSVTQHNKPVDYHTGNIIWGGVGSTGQHAYHQLLHQGTFFIPCDFIVTYSDPFLFSQCLAQSRTLMLGNPAEQPCKQLHGNRPSTTIAVPKLSPTTLGMLLALYEHRVYTQACLWDINPFDQWGVEQGKKAGQTLLNTVKYHKLLNDSDSSTAALLEKYYENTKD